ncbi:MAG TPA: histidine kinase [Patescibacteria group bacterium]|nr:histidine kinase [Patescibacteria group bacterium]
MSPSKQPAAADADFDPDRAGADNLAGRLAADIRALDAELTEIEMLVAQAATEAGRHEQKRAQAAEKLTAVNLPPEDLVTLNAQLVLLTRRASVMESQVDVLEGKRKTLSRYRDALVGLADAYGAEIPDPAVRAAVPRLGAGGAISVGGAIQASAADGPVPAMSRIVLNAQEDLRREIARAMHDGPAQSLTNIVLQAQIVERLLGRDPDGARAELRLLVSMVQHTLEATKAFIFDVRPMVLDDLGLVPTLRRAARERGRRGGIPVEFETIGQDRRLSVDLESTMFRIIDEALTGYVSVRPDRIAIQLEWFEDLVEARVSADRDPTRAMNEADEHVADVARAAADRARDLPPALESMMADRRERAAEAAVAARDAAVVSLPTATWREIQQRAQTTGVGAELSDGGGTLVIRVDLGASADDPDESA